MTNCKIRFTLM